MKRYNSVAEFLAMMDAGEFDGHLPEALKTLGRDELEQLAESLLRRSKDNEGDTRNVG
jgi:hypothetical protein